MLAEKLHQTYTLIHSEKKDKPLSPAVRAQEIWQPEALIENITNILFKVILFAGIPYFLFVFIKFLLLI